MLIDRRGSAGHAGLAMGSGFVDRRRGRAALDPGVDLRSTRRPARRGESRAARRGSGRAGVLARGGGPALGTAAGCDCASVLGRLRIKELIVPHEPSSFSGGARVLLPPSADPRRRVRLAAEGAPRQQAHTRSPSGPRSGPGDRADEMALLIASHHREALRYLGSSATPVRRGRRRSAPPIAGRGSPATGRQRCGCSQKRSSGTRKRLARPTPQAPRWRSGSLPPGSTPRRRFAAAIDERERGARVAGTSRSRRKPATSSGPVGRRPNWRGSCSTRAGTRRRRIWRRPRSVGSNRSGDSRELAFALNVAGWYRWRRGRYEEAEPAAAASRRDGLAGSEHEASWPRQRWTWRSPSVTSGQARGRGRDDRGGVRARDGGRHAAAARADLQQLRVDRRQRRLPAGDRGPPRGAGGDAQGGRQSNTSHGSRGASATSSSSWGTCAEAEALQRESIELANGDRRRSAARRCGPWRSAWIAGRSAAAWMRRKRRTSVCRHPRREPGAPGRDLPASLGGRDRPGLGATERGELERLRAVSEQRQPRSSSRPRCSPRSSAGRSRWETERSPIANGSLGDTWRVPASRAPQR